MTFWLLLGVKLRLLRRSVLRGSTVQTVVGTAILALVLAPVWLGLGGTASAAVTRHGAEGAAAVLGTTHLGWLVSAFMFSAFAEGLDLRVILRYPVRPAVVFVMNVLLAPFDLVALFLAAPLVAAVVAAGRVAGFSAAAGVALACLLTILVTGVCLHILLAALGRFLRREWSRAVAGLLLGMAFAAPSIAMHQQATSRGGGLSAMKTAVDDTIPTAARVAALCPTSAFPVMVARAAMRKDPLGVAGGLLGTALLLAAGIALGTRWTTAAALHGEVTLSPPSRSPASRGRPAPWEGILGTELAVLVGRDLRYWLRTPQVLLGLLTTPAIVIFFSLQPSFSPGMRTFFLPFFCLVSVLNLSANQFGLDREGVRLLFLLPVQPRQLVAAKNLAAAAVAAAATGASLVAVRLIRHTPLLELGPPAFAVLATLPAVLIAGNELSSRHPWRMTFRIGGTPPGAMASALTQMMVVLATAVLLAVPAVAGSVLGAPAITVAGTAAVGAIAWTIWWLSLPRAARKLTERRETLLAVLAHPHETG